MEQLKDANPPSLTSGSTLIVSSAPAGKCETKLEYARVPSKNPTAGRSPRKACGEARVRGDRLRHVLETRPCRNAAVLEEHAAFVDSCHRDGARRVVADQAFDERHVRPVRHQLWTGVELASI